MAGPKTYSPPHASHVHMRRSLKIGGGVALALGLLVAAGLALGILGVPSITGVENSFGPVEDTHTVIYTDLHVTNPNPVGITLGGVTADYNVSMNGVAIANGSKSGLAIGTGNSTLNLTTRMDNEQIPAWWYTHVRNGESTTVQIDATATSSTLGQSAKFGQQRQIETDIAGQFDSNETRAVDAEQPLVGDPVLYINSTRGSWDRANLTRERTPLDLDFTVYNPKSFPYTVSKIGYNISMNGVPVGEGETDRGYVIRPRTADTIRANTAIQNENLDEWWVTHLERNQVTDLSIDFYLIVEIGGEQVRVDLDSIDYEKRIETDIFGTKPTGNQSNTTATSGTQTVNETTTESDLVEETIDGTIVEETTDGGLLDTTESTVETQTDTASGASTDTDTDEGILGGETATATDDGTSTDTDTDDGLL